MVNFVRGVFNEVIIGNTDRVLILTNINTEIAKISDVRVNVEEWFDAILGPSITHVVPVVVPLSIELPVPEKSDTFGELMLPNPVLHPHTDHW